MESPSLAALECPNHSRQTNRTSPRVETLPSTAPYRSWVEEGHLGSLRETATGLVNIANEGAVLVASWQKHIFLILWHLTPILCTRRCDVGFQQFKTVHLKHRQEQKVDSAPLPWPLSSQTPILGRYQP